MVDNYKVVPNRAERRKKQKLIIGGVGHISAISQEADRRNKHNRVMKEFVNSKKNRRTK